MTHAARVLDLLSDGQPHTHTEGYRLGVMFHSRVADLRKKGHTIECWRDGDLYLYQLVSPLGGPEAPSLREKTGDGLDTDVGCSGAVTASGPPSGEPYYGHAHDLAALLAREDMRKQVQADQLTLEIA